MALSTLGTQAVPFNPTFPFPIAHTPARLLETAEAAFLRSQIRTVSRFYPDEKFATIPLRRKTIRSETETQTGLAGATKRSFDWKLNRVVGFGMDGPVTGHELDGLERLSRRVGLTPYIDLCPFAHPSARELLAQRGYRNAGDINVHILPLQDVSFDDSGDSTRGRVEITRVSTSADRSHFIESSLAGFEQDAGDSKTEDELLKLLAECATLQPETRTYLARLDGRIAGGAGMAYLPTPQGPVTQLHITSTVPEFRGRGVQGALLRARLADAKASGIRVAVVNTRPGSVSVRNVGK
ncbi:GNAT family N-acetyltransferase [Aspergillus mulundensis]|uniref:N-acetyltransferase domain-containing protein n=1 Tax=Aspergillus mulundensis TaxID=1810919 RepID=A0A3D8T346_9EURO|nr:hypothetical protein DSM5745_00307 [Aspergillus mulundensis]RDW92985.1 hypothetical protein DSM5745_00307 [Aspergillus mulundensis]